MTLKENVTELKLEMEKLATVTTAIEAEKVKYENAVKDLEVTKAEISKKIADLKVNINTDAVEEFKASGTKSFFGGIGVQERKKVVYDEATVFEWAKAKNMFIMLDVKSFDKSAEAMIKADPVIAKAVTITKEPQATYPKEIKLED